MTSAVGPEGLCWLVDRDEAGGVCGRLAPLPRPASAAGSVIVEVEAAGFNYKDALACSGHPGVARQLPHVPGIDAAGVLRQPTESLPAGTPVVVTGNGLGETCPGSFANWLLAPTDAVIRRPPTLSAVAAMALGTAGLTAVVAVERLTSLIDWEHQQFRGGAGPPEWLVTGASGGVRACWPLRLRLQPGIGCSPAPGRPRWRRLCNPSARPLFCTLMKQLLPLPNRLPVGGTPR